MLDIGCGSGFLLKDAEDRGLTTFAVDISPEAAKIASRIAQKSIILVGDAENLSFANKTFDYVTCLGTLEHRLDMEQGIREMTRVAKDDAEFLIMVPNLRYFAYMIRRSYGTEQKKVCEHLLTMHQWIELFSRNNLKIKRIDHDRWQMKNMQVNSLKKIALKAIWSVLPLQLTYQFVFVLQKKAIK